MQEVRAPDYVFILATYNSGFWVVKLKRSIISVPLRWLCNESLPPTSRRWSVEGLAYLTFDADVKEDLVEDKNALLAMFDLAKVVLIF